ncbi:MAG TPA: CPBP family intramembrane glutamic endopeptidase [Polyangiaceae bacterium]
MFRCFLCFGDLARKAEYNIDDLGTSTSNETSPAAPGRAGWLKLLGVAVVWIAVGRYLPIVLWHALPRVLLDSLTLPIYNMLCQVITTGFGFGLAWILFRQPRALLGLNKPSGWHLLVTALLAPAIFVLASSVALKIAEPYLLEELATQGAGASRRNAGAFGKAITQAPVVVTMLWGAVLAAIAEEMMFRGPLFSLLQDGTSALLARRRDPASEPRESKQDRWIAGSVAIVVAAAAFGTMHADMKGSVGIVRVVSATCLGVACGTARFLSGTVLLSMLLHFVYNTISLGVGRGWFNGLSEPILLVVPNPLLVAAIAGVMLAVGIRVARYASSGKA